MSGLAGILPIFSTPEPCVWPGGETVICTAKKGGGKSRRCVDFICDELLCSDRTIITNLPVHVGNFCDWAYEYYNSKEIDVAQRLVRVSDAVMYRFFLLTKNRSERLPLVRDATDSPDVLVPELQKRAGDGGILFIFDEIQNFYRTRSWKSVGPEVDFYLSQSRKLNDVLIAVTQDPDKVSVDFRRNATRHIYIENLHKRRMLLGVTLPGWFHWGSYIDAPRKNEPPDDEGYFALRYQDRHKLYDTMAGVGLDGKVRPDVKGVHGLHWATWPVAGALMMVAAWLFVPALAKTVNLAVSHFAKRMGGQMDSALSAVRHPVGASAAGAVLSVAGPGVGAPDGALPSSGAQIASSDATFPKLFCTGYANVDGKPLVFLSDGTVYSTEDGVELITAHWVQIDRHRYPVEKQSVSNVDTSVPVSSVQSSVPMVANLHPARPAAGVDVTFIGRSRLPGDDRAAISGWGGSRGTTTANNVP